MDEHDEKPASLDRYWDPQLETLGELLDQLSDDGAMNLEELDGFFAALHCCPEFVSQSEYMAEILNFGEALDNEEIFPNPEAAKLFWGLVLHHWDAVRDALNTDDFFLPLLLEDEEGKAQGNDWTVGFISGVNMRKEAWSEIYNDEVKFEWFAPILALAYENDTDSDVSSDQEPLTEEAREKLLASLSAGVSRIYRYFAPHRKLRATLSSKVSTSEERKSKIGRNDPCYCGSHKKYKKCCGAFPVN